MFHHPHTPSHHEHCLIEEDNAEDRTKVLLICKDTHSSNYKSLVFWLKLQGHNVIFGHTEEEAKKILETDIFPTVFADIVLLETFPSKIFPLSGLNENSLLLGYSSREEDETATLPFAEEKAIALRHDIHYYFPDPLEVKDLLEWIFVQRREQPDVKKLCRHLDRDIRMNHYHNRDIIPIETRHNHELSADYANKIEAQHSSESGSSKHPVLDFVHHTAASIRAAVTPRSSIISHHGNEPK